jgi:EPS-associated MarR family transcriptional regulator
LSRSFVRKLYLASRRKEHQEDAKSRMFQIIIENPQITTRELAQKVGISNGSAYYLLTSLIDMGFVKLSNFKESSQKIKYSYLLTPKGIREKSLITNKFLVRKKQEFETLRKEINSLEKTVGNVLNSDHEDV